MVKNQVFSSDILRSRNWKKNLELKFGMGLLDKNCEQSKAQSHNAEHDRASGHWINFPNFPVELQDEKYEA